MLETHPSRESVDLQLITYQEEMAVATNRQLTTNKLSGQTLLARPN